MDIFSDILRRDELLKQKRSLSQAKAVEDELKDISVHQAKALQSSNMILKDSREKQIEELYRMLLASTHTTHSANNASICERSQEESTDEISDFKARILDFNLVHTDVMIPEVNSLLLDMRREYEEICRMNRTETFEDREEEDVSKQSSIPLTFDEFRRLALRAIRHRNGTGKAYVCAPRKKPEVAMQMVINHLKEETFHPVIDKASKQMVVRHQPKFKNVAIEDILQAEGERMKSKKEIAKFEKFVKESKDYTYKPTLFKPPSYVKAKYRGMEEEEGEEREQSRAVGGTMQDVAEYFDDNSTIGTEDLLSLSDSVQHHHPLENALPPLSGHSAACTPCRVHDVLDVSYLSVTSPGEESSEMLEVRVRQPRVKQFPNGVQGNTEGSEAKVGNKDREYTAGDGRRNLPDSEPGYSHDNRNSTSYASMHQRLHIIRSKANHRSRNAEQVGEANSTSSILSSTPSYTAAHQAYAQPDKIIVADIQQARLQSQWLTNSDQQNHRKVAKGNFTHHRPPPLPLEVDSRRLRMGSQSPPPPPPPPPPLYG